MRRVRGFTLIEVLVALAIVVIGMAAVLGALSSSASTLAYLRDKTFAQWVALNQIANVRLAGQAPPTGNTEGDTDFAGRSWHWRQEVVTTQVPGIERMDVKVRPAEIKPDNEDSGWFTTVSGLWGDAVGAPNGFQPDWGGQLPRGAAPGTPGAPGTLGNIQGSQGTQPFSPNITPRTQPPATPPSNLNLNSQQ